MIMKTMIPKIKNHIIGFLIWAFTVTSITVFAASGAWSIWSLFEDIGWWVYRLIWSNIKSDTVDTLQLKDGWITAAKIQNTTNQTWSFNNWKFKLNSNWTVVSTSTVTATSFIWNATSASTVPATWITSWWGLSDWTIPASKVSGNGGLITSPGTWTNVVSNTYAPGPWNNNSPWRYVYLDWSRKVLGIRISGTTDDGWLCIAWVSGYFFGAALYNASLTNVDVYGDWTNGALANNGSNGSYNATYIFDGLEAWEHQKYGQWAYGNTCNIDVLYSY